MAILKEYVLACMHTLTYTMFAATSQKYFSLTPNQYQPAVFFYHNKSASATAQRTEAIIYHTTHLSQFLYSRANCSAFWNPEGFFPRCNQALSWTRTLHSRTSARSDALNLAGWMNMMSEWTVMAGFGWFGWKRLVCWCWQAVLTSGNFFGAKAHYTFKFNFLCQCNTLHEQNGAIRADPITLSMNHRW